MSNGKPRTDWKIGFQEMIGFAARIQFTGQMIGGLRSVLSFRF